MSKLLDRTGWILKSEYGLLAVLILISLVLGFLLADDYGLSADENLHVIYGEETIEVYQGTRGNLNTVKNLRYYGPFYSVFASLGVSFLQGKIPGYSFNDLYHLMYYLVFPSSLFFLYDLMRRFVQKPAALIMTGLYFTQPLLFGHAFINPKDLIFLAFFLASTAVGFRAVDAAAGNEANSRPYLERLKSDFEQGKVSLTDSWRRRKKSTRLVFVFLLVVFTAVVLDLNFGGILAAVGKWFVETAHTGGEGVLRDTFLLFAEDAYKTPLDAYYARVDSLVSVAGKAGFVLLFLGFVVLSMRHFSCFRQGWNAWFLVLAAGMIMGITVSIRVFGGFSGVLVSLYFLQRMQHRSVFSGVVYWLAAGAAAYATWPFLWGAPLGRFRETLEMMRSFPWSASILYAGKIYRNPEGPPWHYVPWLITIQLTLPAQLLGLGGFLDVLRKPRKLFGGIPGLLLLWFITPVVGSFLPDANLYDNFRQLLFVLPPVFVLGSVPLQAALNRLKKPVWKFVLAAVLVIPGIAGIIRLHPYEYIYYNELAGGVSGAFEEYELDYWYTSGREAAEWINENAAQNAVIGYHGSFLHLEPFLREDLQLISVSISGKIRDQKPDYAVLSFRGDHYRDNTPAADVVHTVSRDGVYLAMVLQYPD